LAEKGAGVKTDIWPEDTGMLKMSDWLAELRNGGDAGTRPADRPVEPVGTSGSRPEPSVAATPNWPVSRIEIFAAEARARAEARADIHADAQARTLARTYVRGRAQITERAVIGDELRMPIMWCEMGSCISWHSDPAALGEADIRTRAIAAGWRVDALGRLACPRCQQSDGRFWATHPVRLRAQDTVPAASECEDAAGAGGGTEAPTIPAVEPALLPLPVQEWQHEPVRHPAVLTD
jgi:hypothetical protein